MSHRPASIVPPTGSWRLRDVMAKIFLALRMEIAATIERRRIRFDLHALDDYLLKDMGISRSDIDRIARRPIPPRGTISTREAGWHAGHH